MDSRTLAKNYTPLLLAAGYGSRIAEITKNPKCLLDIAGKTILDRHLETWVKLGFKKAIIVLGFKADLIKNHLESYQDQIEITFVLNEDYRNLGNTYSLKIGLEMASTGVLVFDADLVYHEDILREFIEDLKADQILTGKASLSDIECTKALIDQDGFVRLTVDKRAVTDEELRTYRFVGEAIGILKFSQQTRLLLLKEAQGFLSLKENLLKNWEYLMNIFLLKHDIGIHSLTHPSWIEIDTPEDYKKANEIFLEANL